MRLHAYVLLVTLGAAAALAAPSYERQTADFSKRADEAQWDLSLKQGMEGYEIPFDLVNGQTNGTNVPWDASSWTMKAGIRRPNSADTAWLTGVVATTTCTFTTTSNILASTSIKRWPFILVAEKAGDVVNQAWGYITVEGSPELDSGDLIFTRSISIPAYTWTGQFGTNQMPDEALQAAADDTALDNRAATNTVDMGSNPITDVGYQDFAPTSGIAHTEGRIWYNKSSRGFIGYTAESEYSHNIGEELTVLVYNNNGVTITNGKSVYASGSTNIVIEGETQRIPLVELALASHGFMGIATHDIETNSLGRVTIEGKVHTIDTSAFSDGDTVWKSPTVAGDLVNVEPSGGDVVFRVGDVLFANATNGAIRLNPQEDFIRNVAYSSAWDGYTQFGVSANVLHDYFNLFDPDEDGLVDNVDPSVTNSFLQAESDPVWTNAQAVGFTMGGDIDLGGNAITNMAATYDTSGYQAWDTATRVVYSTLGLPRVDFENGITYRAWDFQGPSVEVSAGYLAAGAANVPASGVIRAGTAGSYALYAQSAGDYALYGVANPGDYGVSGIGVNYGVYGQALGGSYGGYFTANYTGLFAEATSGDIGVYSPDKIKTGDQFVGSGTGITNLPVAGIDATGTPDATTFLRGDGSWQVPAGGGGGGFPVTTGDFYDDTIKDPSAAAKYPWTESGVTIYVRSLLSTNTAVFWVDQTVATGLVMTVTGHSCWETSTNQPMTNIWHGVDAGRHGTHLLTITNVISDVPTISTCTQTNMVLGVLTNSYSRPISRWILDKVDTPVAWGEQGLVEEYSVSVE